MPHINRIRVNNVKYNFGTQFYDDFVMRFDGRNALYDLANGGGKSVLMLLLFQNLIPNCTLDDKQPVEKLFRTSDGSTTIHSLVEWKLDPGAHPDDYKYMLTGFCARKAKDEDNQEKAKDAASIDYYNYVIFYREYNDNDIVNLPLKKGNERITYGGLKGYLKDLGRNDYRLDVQIFERKGEYQRFISKYGLFESAWEIVRGINKTEGHVRTYFETNYRTTRKVIEDLLIEEIIQKAFLARSDRQETDMAKMLMDIKDKLMELSKCKEEISGYDRQMEVLESFAGRIESLDKLYGEADTFATELIKIYNTATMAVKQAEKAQALAAKEKELSGGHIGEISRKLDTVKIQENQERLKSCQIDTDKFEEEINELRKYREQLQLELNLKQSINDYDEYQHLKKEAAKVRHAMDNAGSDDEQLQRRLIYLAAMQKKLYDEKQKAWGYELVELKRTLALLEDASATLLEQRRNLDKEQAVAINDYDREKINEKELIDALSGLRMQLNTLLLEGAEKELKNNRIEAKKWQKTLEDEMSELEAVKNRILDTKVRLENLKVTGAKLDGENEALARFFEEYDKKKVKADKLMEVYRAGDYYALKSVIYGRYKKVIMDIFKYREMIAHDRTYLEQLSTMNPVVEAAQRDLVMDYIRRCHGVTCVSGSDYVSGLDVEERKTALLQMPWLPYGVIVKNDFEKVAADHLLREKDFGDLACPIVALEDVVNPTTTLMSHMFYVGQNPELFYDSDAISKKVNELTKKLETSEKELARLLDNEATYLSDVEYLGHFITNYQDVYNDKMAEVAVNRKQLDALKNERQSLSLQMTEDETTVESKNKSIEDAKEKLESLDGEAKVLMDIAEKEAHLDECQKQVRKLADAKRSLEVRLSQTQLALEDNTAKHGEASIRATYLKSELDNIKKIWDERYSVYYDDSVVVDSDTVMPGDEIEAQFMGLREAYEKKHSDMEDKRQLLESYEASASRMLSLIEERSVDIDELQELYTQATWMTVSEDEIRSEKEKMTQISAEIRVKTQMVQQVRANKDRLFGSVENAIAVVEEKYGSFVEVDLKNHDYETYLREQSVALENMKAKYAKAATDMEKAAKDLRAAEEIRRDLDRLIRTAKVGYNRTRDFYTGDVRLRVAYDTLNDQFERLRKEEDRRRDEFEKNRDRLADTLRELKAFELSDEVRYHMELPKTGDEAALLLENIRETVQIIGLEKQRIRQGIQDMVQIKESFVNQCLQRCLDIRTELERLPKLSVITLDNRQIPMVQLKIPYVREEFYNQQMSTYIDTVVANADAYKDYEEKLKYIRQKLSWKSLFSVIVTDMNAIRLNLYKRERIREQSRYLKYEEAVGSTGQSQGIYIQFLIAVINYISAMNSGSTDAIGAGKVIFIDNPFGAAKDIYIWEPIFELLKTNNVQLIVPARGATPAISGKFDVNYVLGQKLIDNKQQTVVIDYHSNIRVEDVEYVKIEFEQAVFDFI